MTNFENIKNFGFDVVSIKHASKENYVTAEIELPNGKHAEITRRYYTVGKGFSASCHFIFKGVKVNFDRFTMVPCSMGREYETKGVIKTSSVLGGKKSISEMVKDEVEDKGIVAKLLDKDEFVDENETIKHEQYETIKACLACGIPVYLAGPAGSGKNFTV